MIPRAAEAAIRQLAKGFPITAITGPRQSGKSTLAQAAFPGKKYLSFEDLELRRFATEDPKGFLATLPDGAVLDEAQRCPDLFSYLQHRADQERRMGLFVLTGSQQFGLLSKITESLAGRVGLVELLPFSLDELRAGKIAGGSLDETLWKGFFPPLYDRPLTPPQWHANYVRTYIERDVRQLAQIRDLGLFQRFMKMCAARTSQLLNVSDLGNDCGLSHVTARHWLSVLEASYIVFLLRPHHENFGKRLVKQPKLYFYDTGLAAHLLQIQNPEHLSIHPSRGALFETFVVSELLKRRFNKGLDSNLHFWRDNVGDEVDILVEEAGHLTPVEIKSGQTLHADGFKTLTQWRKIAKRHSGELHLIYGGDETRIQNGIHIASWRAIPNI